MRIGLTESRGELGRVLAEAAAARGHEIVEPGGPADVLVVLAAQRPNTLLHDGHYWKRQSERLPARAVEAVDAIRTSGARHAVVASCAFLWTAPDDPDFAAAADLEKVVASAGVPTGIVRLGWLYGPRLRDSEHYRVSWVLRRPYYAGPASVRQSFLHHDDAAAVLLEAVERRFEGLVDAVDAEPIAFGRFMDRFARMLGFWPAPLHLPRFVLPLLLGQIEAHQVALLDVESVRTPDAAGRSLGWSPRFPTWKEGLADTVTRMGQRPRRS